MKQDDGIKHVLIGLAVCVVIIVCIVAVMLFSQSVGNFLREDFYNIVAYRDGSRRRPDGEEAAQIDRVIPVTHFSPKNAVYAEDERLSFRCYTVYLYDAQGNCVEESCYETDGSLNNIELSGYDERGNLTARRKEYPLWGWDTTEKQYGYDEEDRVIYQKSLKNGKLQTRWEYEYHMKDGLVYQTMQEFSAKGEAQGKREYVKNSRGDTLEYTYYDKDGEPNRSIHYEYDEQGRQVYYYIQKGSAKKPMREIFTQYEEQDSIWITYEPLGHLNALEYINCDTEGNKLSDVYYLSGYQGYKESQWNTHLSFWEGYWADYYDGLLTEELGYSDSLKYYKFYVYEGEQKTLKLEYEEDGSIADRSLTHYLYVDQGRLAVVYEYGILGYDYELELNDGSILKLSFHDKNGYLKEVERSSASEMIEQLSFDEKGKPIKQYIPRFGELPKWGDPCPWNDEHFPWEEKLENEPMPPEYYVVEEGDCLWGIAQNIYGNAFRYRDIYEKNRKLIGEDENLIFPGMELELP